MPGKGPSTNHLPTEPSSTHSWLSPEGRRLEIESGKPLLHRFCTTCHRNFVCDLLTDTWYAVFPRLFDFELLDDVRERWLNEVCPEKYLDSDVEARKSTSIRSRNVMTNSDRKQRD